MCILTEQAMLAIPDLADVTRPGSSMRAAAYAFATARGGSTEPETIINPQFVSPSPYSIDQLFGAVTKTAQTASAGINGESLLFDAAPTQYGPGPFNRLADLQQTNLGAAAEVISGKSEATDLPMTPSVATQMSSSWNKEVNQNVPEASGGSVAGYTSNNHYSINKSPSAPSVSDDAAAAALSDLSDEPTSGRPRQSVDKPKAAGGGCVTPKVRVPNPIAAMLGDIPVATGQRRAPRQPGWSFGDSALALLNLVRAEQRGAY